MKKIIKKIGTSTWEITYPDDIHAELEKASKEGYHVSDWAWKHAYCIGKNLDTKEEQWLPKNYMKLLLEENAKENNKQIYNKAKEAHRKAYEIVEIRLDEELISAIDDLVVLSVSKNLSLEELLSGKYDPKFEGIIEVVFKGRGNTCGSGLICWDTLRQTETEYITAAYNFIVAGRNI